MSASVPAQETLSPNTTIPAGDKRPSHLAALQEAIEQAAHLLPSQGPITVFIHHNTLHAFEEMPFDEAVQKGARIFGCQPYLTEDRYREELVRGRIRFADLREVLREDLKQAADEKVLDFCTRLELRLAMLQYPLRSGSVEELLWHVAETDALRRVRREAGSAVREQFIAETRHWFLRDLRETGDGRSNAKHGSERRAHDEYGVFSILKGIFGRLNEKTIEDWSNDEWEEFALRALWGTCCQGVADVPPLAAASPAPIRHRDLLLAATGEDTDLRVHDLLIRFCAAFLDQGLAPWPLLYRDEGFFRSFCALYRRSGSSDRWRRGLSKELHRLEDAQAGPLESIHESLEILGVPEGEWHDYVTSTLLALRGWAGMIQQMELLGDRVGRPAPQGSLLEYLAIRLVLERLVLAETARDALGFTGPLCALRDEVRKRLDGSRPPSMEQRAFLVFQLAQVLSWTPEKLHHLSKQEWQFLLHEIETFSSLERRRIFHRTYERRFCTRSLDALALHALKPAAAPAKPRFQALFCIDEREESLRRHLEELAPDAETFSLAGFFFIPMYYRGASDAHFVPLCPAVMRPQHWVVEQVVDHLEETHHRRAGRRRALGMASHRLHLGSRTFALGALLATAAGVLASIPLIARIFSPRWTSRLRRRLGRFLQTPSLSRLQLERCEPTPGPTNGQVGLTLDEMTGIGERVLRDIGLTSNFARLVLVLGHGSTSMNNPHESAHDCGACGGSRGGPNARALAQILNDSRIRERLKQRGIAIPPHTVFLGGLHNTSSERVTFDDLDRLPASHRDEFETVRALLQDACDRNAHERSRRFASAPLTLTFAAARQHVEGRAEDLAQVRPEWGHATNALSIVGRRASTRGLFLDRRAFLTSYDAAQDDADHTILTRVLQAVFPVCAGINLEYYFSYVDNSGWGSGTKLPHNITSLVGVMDGAASDLRTGLPWQMVEIHEPVRLLNVIETSPEAMLQVLERNESIGRLCRNGWVHLAVMHPETRQISLYHDGRFQDYHPQASSLPTAASSVDWYRGWRDHLEFARIESHETVAPDGKEHGHA